MAENDFFTELAGTDKRTNIPSTISSPVWSGGATTLTSFYTGSAQSGSSGDYYYDVFDKVGTDTTREVQFAIAYGHFDGSGSLSTSAGNNPSKAIYRQFRNICIRNANSDSKFEFPENNTNVFKDIYVINVNRARYRERLDPGNWELHLGTGDPGLIKLIDDSGAGIDPTIGDAKREFNVVSGSVANGVHTTATSTATATSSGSYGLFYPELGMILLNPNSLQSGSGYNNSQGYIEPLVKSTSTNDLNHRKILHSIESGSYFAARREEKKRSSFYFCRIPNFQFNHSQNPSYFTGSNAALTQNDFIKEPVTYITTIGLYNNLNELLGVAKLSKPFKKDPNTEALIKVRLDY